MKTAECLGQINPGNKTAIQALVLLLESTQDEDTSLRIAKCLGQLDPGNETAIQALVLLFESTQDEDICLRAAECLGQIDPGNKTAVQKMLWLFEFSQNKDTRFKAVKAVTRLGKIGTSTETAMQILVRSLRYPFRSKESYELMMKCAEALPYREFYQAFHASHFRF